MIQGSWLMAHGSRLMAQGIRRDRGSTGILARRLHLSEEGSVMAVVDILVLSLLVAQSPTAPHAWSRAPLAQGTGAPITQASLLDYDTYRTRVQPILVAVRKGNSRCASCHSRGGGNAFLEPLPPGSETYTEQQSRR